MKRVFVCTPTRSYLSLGLMLIVSAWGGAMWNRSPRPDHHGTPSPDIVTQTSHEATKAATQARLKEAYGQLPLSFEANLGQADPRIDFISRGSGYTLFLTPREAVLSLRDARNNSQSPAVLRMKFAGSDTKPRAAGQEELPGKVNYFIGNDPKQWRTGISTYAKVHYENLYPGVDLVYYGNQRQLEYDFVVRPGADPNIIALNFEGADQLKVDAQGELVLHTRGGEIRQRKPVIYQDVDGVRQEVAGSYKLKDSNTVGFELAEYDASRPLVIDPVLVYSTFLGGANVDTGVDIVVDAAGNAYVTGTTQLLIIPSTFPTTAGAFDTTHNGEPFDVFVTKLNPTGSALVYSTFLGGSNLDSGAGIAIDSAGNAYVTGTTESSNFPTTPGAFDTTFNGDRDVFVTKLNPTGSALVYSTFLGGFESDLGSSIAVDSSGAAYITGNAFPAFPITPGAIDPVHNFQDIFEAFVTKLNPTGSALVYSTYLGGDTGSSGSDIAVDDSGNAYVVGSAGPGLPTTPGAFDTENEGSGGDVFVAKINVSGSALVYSTFLGGSTADEGRGIALDAAGNAYVSGTTTSIDFPTTAGAFDTTQNGSFDAFVTKLNASGSALVYSTFLGGVNFESANEIAVDSAGSAYVTGSTSSPTFPTTADAFDTTYNGNNSDAFVTQVNPSGSALIYSTFLGGTGNGSTGIADDTGLGIAVDSIRGIYVSGNTRSPDFPTTPGAFDTTFNGVEDAFVTKFSTFTSGVPATLTLNPPTATNTVDAQHCVTATVRDASGSPVANVVVRFEVSGAVDTSGTATTDANGEATFCYVGPPLPGADTITAFADTDNNTVQDSGEPSGVAEKTWVVPASTPLCEVTNSGWIVAANGDRATFSGHAKADESGATQGQQKYMDHGPAHRLLMDSINVQAVVCDGSRASIFGQATIDGSGIFNFRINVQDLGVPGKGGDTYSLLIDGYSSGEQILGGGNIQIRRK
jgi:beta-propeller repeat-containing protein